MILFHGSTQRVENPLVGIGRDDLDFGRGFYLTRLRSQAEAWAERISFIRASEEIWLNTYDFDMERASKDGFKTLSFTSYDRDWLEFIVASRQGKQPWKEYDIVEGGVADDRVINAVEAYINGLADIEHTLGLLAYTKPNHQICLLNQEMVDKHLKYIESIQITK